ncbi:MAG: Dyp-type peroxidase [Actinomycetota bacterium]
MSSTLELGDIQGILARGYGNLKAAGFLLLAIDDAAAAKRWLTEVAELLTPADRRPERLAVNLAFTAGGLTKLGLPPDAITGFSFEFRNGMTSAHRSRVLGDAGASDPAGWVWGGPSGGEIDVLVLLYARDARELEIGLAEVNGKRAGVSEVVTLPTVPLTDREHFGFHDGVSQPAIEGLGRAGSPSNTVRAGEFILGYPNEYGLYADGPTLDRSADPARMLPPSSSATDRADLGKNGSYLVVRQLAQDVSGFWQFVEGAATALENDGDDKAVIRLAAKMMGRWPSGAPLVEAPERDDPRLSDSNDFAYHRMDPHGLRCPKGSHVRRSHPRDSLDPDPGSEKSVAIGKRHRILRRGRQYGTWVSPLAPAEAQRASENGATEDDERGLYFMCLNANLARQFEFVQHTWVNNSKFDGLYDDPDPVVATQSSSGRSFTVPAAPVRRRVTGVPTFVTVRGGAYFFLPGIRAVRYLASLE